MATGPDLLYVLLVRHAWIRTLTTPQLVGITLNWYLYGLLSVQYLLYILYARNDKTITKLIVHSIFLLDTIQTILMMDDTFFWFAYNFGDTGKLNEFHIAAIDIPVFDAIIALIVQNVYCWRMWVLSRWRVIPILAALICLLAGLCGITIGIRDTQLGNIFNFDEHYRIPFMVSFCSMQTTGVHYPDSQFVPELWLVGSAVGDIIIAISMTFILLKATKESSGIDRTLGKKVKRLLTLILETNAVTAAVALEIAITFFIKESHRSARPRISTILGGSFFDF
ncbi:hypothetical protein AN958_10309 [Leucoagaricus sp. SymC.cos]|nr:hypothetical protein AN958_10309 [Leucoagaricus sp. SymC.cos]